MTAPATAERVLCSAHLYRPARNTYQRFFNRDYVGYRRAGRAFYGQFVGRGDLVFDLGANRGLMAEMFLELGARVIAVEPIPTLAMTIRRRYPSRALVVEQCAVGDEPGTATLRLGADDLHSSISDEWIQRAEADPAIPNRWTESFAVPVRTPDDLIAQYGTPTFIKIDVEGFEDHVLAGLSRPVGALSFEFQAPALDMTRACLDRLDELGHYEYQLAEGEQLAFREPAWMDADDAMDLLEALRAEQPVTHGDIYARLRG